MTVKIHCAKLHYLGAKKCTDTKIGEDKPISHHKSRVAALSWRTCYDKLNKSGLFKALMIYYKIVIEIRITLQHRQVVRHCRIVIIHLTFV